MTIKLYEIKIPVEEVQVFRVRAKSRKEALKKYERNDPELLQLQTVEGTTKTGDVEVEELKTDGEGSYDA